MRKILNIIWGASIGSALVLFIMALGALNPNLKLYAIGTSVTAAIALIGLAVNILEDRAYGRGWDAHGEEIRKEKQP